MKHKVENSLLASNTSHSLGSEAKLYVSENDNYEKVHIDIQSVSILSYLGDKKYLRSV